MSNHGTCKHAELQGAFVTTVAIPCHPRRSGCDAAFGMAVVRGQQRPAPENAIAQGAGPIAMVKFMSAPGAAPPRLVK